MNLVTKTPIKLGIVMDPIEGINYKKDTSLGLLLAAQERGYQLFYMRQQDLFMNADRACAEVTELQVFPSSECWFQYGSSTAMDLGHLDVILMRKDPPFDMKYIYSSYILEVANNSGCLVVNNPRSIRDSNEKLFISRFPQCCPPLLVSCDNRRLRKFHSQYKDVVYKPLDGMGGTSVFRVVPGDLNLNVIIETLTENGSLPIMAQQYIPEIAKGDKRILMVDGTPVPYALARIPAAGDIRGNLASGGKGVVQGLSRRDLWIADQVGSSLKKLGLMFVGLDIIGDYLTEINVTSPTCLREIDSEKNIGIGALLMEAIERALHQKQTQ